MNVASDTLSSSRKTALRPRHGDVEQVLVVEESDAPWQAFAARRRHRRDDRFGLLTLELVDGVDAGPGGEHRLKPVQLRVVGRDHEDGRERHAMLLALLVDAGLVEQVFEQTLHDRSLGLAALRAAVVFDRHAPPEIGATVEHAGEEGRLENDVVSFLHRRFGFLREIPRRTVAAYPGDAQLAVGRIRWRILQHVVDFRLGDVKGVAGRIAGLNFRRRRGNRRWRRGLCVGHRGVADNGRERH